MTVEETVRTYYETLEAGEALAPFFADDDRTVKFGLSETLRGGEAVTAGLRSQTERTTDWHIESRELVVGEREAWAWFTDEVFMAWTDTERRIRYEFDTRWSGTLERRDDEWQFVAMHVSTAGDL
jgi:hypothetical protein